MARDDGVPGGVPDREFSPARHADRAQCGACRAWWRRPDLETRRDPLPGGGFTTVRRCPDCRVVTLAPIYPGRGESYWLVARDGQRVGAVAHAPGHQWRARWRWEAYGFAGRPDGDGGAGSMAEAVAAAEAFLAAHPVPPGARRPPTDPAAGPF